MLSYPAGITVSNHALITLSDALRHRRSQTGTRWRRLTVGQQARLVLAHLRKGDTYAELACGFGVGTCGVPEVGPGSLTSGDRWSVMIPRCRCGGVGHGRGVRVAPGPFPVPARRTGRACLHASGSPRVLPVAQPLLAVGVQGVGMFAPR